MVYPNLQININKKRGDDSSAQMINTPVILDMAVQLSEEKNNFAFSHHPSLNQFKPERLGDDKINLQSLQTPILELNHMPFFNPSSNAITPDTLNNFVAPNEILNQFTTATSSTSTSTTNTYNDLNHLNTANLQHHPLSMASKLLSPDKQQQQSQQQNIHQNDYHQFNNTNASYNSSAQVNQYASNLNILGHQTDMNDNLTTLNHLHLTGQQQHQQSAHNNLTYTELKPSNHQSDLIPNSVYDVSAYKKHQDQPPSYLAPTSPTNSMSSQTSSSNLDNQDSQYGNVYGESSSHMNRSNRRHPGQSSSSANEKKSRMTKKQKYDSMINEEKTLMKNNDQLKSDIKHLEDMIVRYKQTIMNTVKNNK